MRVKILAAAALCGVVLLSSCMDVREEITISPSGSGTFVSHTDMSRGMALLKKMSPPSGGASALSMFAPFDKPIDYTSTLLVLPDSFSTHLAADPEKGLLTFDTRAYVNDLAGLQKMQERMTQQLAGFQYMLQMMMGQGRPGSDSGKLGLGMLLKGRMLQTSWNPHQIKRTFNQALYDSVTALKGMQPPPMMAAMGQDGRYDLIFHLPAPVQHVEGGPYTLSSDRKTVTFEKKFMDIFKDPKNLAFTIDY
jgi:hypothetical protein